MISSLYKYTVIFLLICIITIFGTVLHFQPEINTTFRKAVDENFKSDVTSLVSLSHQSDLKHLMNNIFNTHKDITSITIYKFIPDEGSNLIKGQYVVSSSAKDNTYSYGKNLISYEQQNRILQEIFSNKIYIDNVKSMEIICSANFNTQNPFSCGDYEIYTQNSKTMIAIPLKGNSNYLVNGYMLILTNSENIKLNELILKLHPTVSNVENIINKGV